MTALQWKKERLWSGERCSRFWLQLARCRRVARTHLQAQVLQVFQDTSQKFLKMSCAGVVDGLQAFREELVVKHQQLLNRLDAELDKAPLLNQCVLSIDYLCEVKLSAPLPPSHAAKPPLPAQPAWVTTLQLPGAVDIDTDDASVEEPPKGTGNTQLGRFNLVRLVKEDGGRDAKEGDAVDSQTGAIP